MRAMPAPWGECPGRRRRSWRAWRRRRCARHRLPPIHRPSAWRRRFRPCGQPHRPPAVRRSQDRQGRGSRGIGLAIRRRGPPLESATVAGLMPSAWRRRSAAFRCVRWAALSRDSSAILGSPSPLTGGVAGAVSGPVSPLGWPLASVLLDPRLSILGGPGAEPQGFRAFHGKSCSRGVQKSTASGAGFGFLEAVPCNADLSCGCGRGSHLHPSPRVGLDPGNVPGSDAMPSGLGASPGVGLAPMRRWVRGRE